MALTTLPPSSRTRRQPRLPKTECMACASPTGRGRRRKRCRSGMALARVAFHRQVHGAKLRLNARPNLRQRRRLRHRNKKTCSRGLAHEPCEKRFQRQQTIPAKQAVRGVWSHHDVAQGLVQELGFRTLLLRQMPRQEGLCQTPHPSVVSSQHEREFKLSSVLRKARQLLYFAGHFQFFANPLHPRMLPKR